MEGLEIGVVYMKNSDFDTTESPKKPAEIKLQVYWQICRYKNIINCCQIYKF